MQYKKPVARSVTSDRCTKASRSVASRGAAAANRPEATITSERYMEGVTRNSTSCAVSVIGDPVFADWALNRRSWLASLGPSLYSRKSCM